MGIYGPSSAFLLVGGRNISSDTFVLSELVESAIEEAHGLGDTFEEQIPIGYAKITLEASGGLYDDRTAGIVEALQAKGETEQVVGYGMAGTAIGQGVVMLNGVLATVWNRIANRSELTKAHALYKVSTQYLRGSILHGLNAETSDPGNTEATSVDRSTDPLILSVAITSSSVAAASVITAPSHGLITGDIIIISGHTGSTPDINGQRTVTVTGVDTFTIPVNVSVGGTGGSFVKVTSTGAVMDLHVPALTLGGFTNVLVKVRDSADNITFADVVSFAAVTAVGSERKTVATAVQRYTAMSWDFVGAGSGQSIIPYVAIARL